MVKGVKTKEEIRQYIWNLLEGKNVVTSPRPVHGRIPNFIGANIAAEKLDELTVWRKARVIKSNPDAPQKWVRENALRHGKTIYMAVPRLREENCFIKLHPKHISNISKAATIKGAFRIGTQVYPDEMDNIDVIVTGSVAVTKDGAKLGKGGGFSDLEYVIAREFDIVDDSTPVLTTVHPLQIIPSDIPMETHDVSLNYIITRDTIISTDTSYPKPRRVDWHIVGEKIKEIPILHQLQQRND